MKAIQNFEVGDDDLLFHLVSISAEIFPGSVVPRHGWFDRTWAGEGQVTFRVYFNHVWAFFLILEHIYLQNPLPRTPAATCILVINQGDVIFVKLRI